MKKKKLVDSILFPIVGLGALSFVVFVLVSYAIIEQSVKNSLSDHLTTNINMFSSSIRADLISGMESETSRKCKSFFRNNGVGSVVVSDHSGRIICNFVRSGNGRYNLTKELFYDELEKEKLATVSLSFNHSISGSLLLRSLFLLFVTLLVLLTGFWLLVRYIVGLNMKQLLGLASSLSSGKIGDFKDIARQLPRNTSFEVETLYKGVETLAESVKVYEEEFKNAERERAATMVETERLRAKSETIQIMAHDIKSPLSSVELVASDPETNPAAKSLLKKSLKRIGEMLEDVNLVELPQNEEEAFPLKAIEISTLVAEEVQDCTDAYLGRGNLKIDFVNEVQWAAEVLINENQFRRALSNLLKNAVEAIGEKEGEIQVLIKNWRSSSIEVAVIDNGKGIPPEKISELGSKGNTFGKTGGSGIGLFQVKKMLSACNGEFVVKSSEGNGASVSMIFPRVENSLKTFVVRPGVNVIVVDDEELIHENWSKKFSGVVPSDQFYCFSSSSEFEQWADLNEDKLETSIGLFDFNLKDEKNGIDLLKAYPLWDRYLVTSEAGNPRIIHECISSGISLIGKNWIGDCHIIELDNDEPPYVYGTVY